jgi:hypothetical protein
MGTIILYQELAIGSKSSYDIPNDPHYLWLPSGNLT